MSVAVSVVIPVYNEREVLQKLFARLYPAMDALSLNYEIIFVDDGSRDRSQALLRAQFEARPDCTRVALLRFNAGQHMAILAGFELARGQRVVTLDADLQNPPEQIVNLLQAMDAGHDLVGTIRQRRQDSAWRRWGSRMMNKMRQATTNIHITDQGCMLRAYDRSIIDLVNGVSLWLRALASRDPDSA
jgi:undecaprenyl-phosphate 4-deoxy-4-formamido-L-arabinose transferase